MSRFAFSSSHCLDPFHLRIVYRPAGICTAAKEKMCDNAYQAMTGSNNNRAKCCPSTSGCVKSTMGVIATATCGNVCGTSCLGAESNPGNAPGYSPSTFCIFGQRVGKFPDFFPSLYFHQLYLRHLSKLSLSLVFFSFLPNQRTWLTALLLPTQTMETFRSGDAKKTPFSPRKKIYYVVAGHGMAVGTLYMMDRALTSMVSSIAPKVTMATCPTIPSLKMERRCASTEKSH
jgi:hypothetical protein